MLKAEINERKIQKAVQKMNGSKSWFFEINMINKPLEKFTKIGRERNLIK